MIRGFIIILFICFSGVELSAQQESFDRLLKNLDEVSEKNAQEKIHLHLDKPYYAVGDDIWFKAYVVNVKTRKPSTISGILYVELIAENDSLVKQLKLQIKNGYAWGDFKLTDSLSEGNYRIRAYTQWMRNAGDSFFFDKTIKVGNSWKNKVFVTHKSTFINENDQYKATSIIQFTDKQKLPYQNAKVNYKLILNGKTIDWGKETTGQTGEIIIINKLEYSVLQQNALIVVNIMLPNNQEITKTVHLQAPVKNFDAQFFPEGGDFIAELPNKIAIKAIGNNGLGELITGKIIDTDGKEITRFETNKLGMGAFFITPIEGQSYKANLRFADGTNKTVSLPAPHKGGIVLSVNNIDSAKMGVKVYFTKNLLNQDEYQLVAHQNGLIFYSTRITSASQVSSLTIPKNNLPSGIIQISLLSATLIPLKERIVFINNSHDKIEIETENLKKNYNTREKTDLLFKFNNYGKPTIGNFSVSITNSSAVIPDIENDTNILTTLLLTSELKGYVEKPNYYFNNGSETLKEELDNLLLTQGWRKFSWKETFENSIPKVEFPIERGQQISGTLMKRKKSESKIKVSLVSFSDGLFMLDTLTDNNGKFVFDNIEFLDGAKFALQARNDNNGRYIDISLDSISRQTIQKNPNIRDVESNINQSLTNYLQQNDRYFDELSEKGKLIKPILLDEVKIIENRSPINPTIRNKYVISDATITSETLKNVHSLSQFFQAGFAGIQVTNGNAFYRGDLMRIVLDGEPNLDIQLGNIIVEHIERIDLFKSMGVISIITNPNKYKNTYTPGLINFTPKGLSVVREFYSPKYDVKPDSKPDLRTTVFWEPQMVSDANGKAKISYFNTDAPGVYRIVVEGIDVNGSIARKVLNYEVK